MLAQLGQLPESDGEGGGLLRILFLVVFFVVIPLANTIKDYFVKRVERNRAEQQARRDQLPIPPTDRPQQQLPEMFLDLPTGRIRIPMGKPADGSSEDLPPVIARPASARPIGAGPAGVGPRQAPEMPPARPRATPADVARRRLQSPATQPPPPKPPPPVAKPVGRQHVQSTGKQPRPEQAQRRRQVSVRSAEDASAAKGQTLGTVNVRDANPHIDIHGGDRIEDGAVASGELGLLPSSFVGMSRHEIRRAIILSEILQPPLSLRNQPGGR